jgi:hypothetical protein
MSNSLLHAIPIDEEDILSIEEMWAEMPISSQYYYDFNIEVYRKYKQQEAE